MATYNLNTDTVPEQLSANDIVNCPYTNGSIKTLVLGPGIYRVEVWGAGNNENGRGALEKGTLRLTETHTFKLCAGGAPVTVGTRTAGTASDKGQMIDEGGKSAFAPGNSSYKNFYSDAGGWSGGGAGASAFCIDELDRRHALIVAAGAGGRCQYGSYSNESGYRCEQAYYYLGGNGTSTVAQTPQSKVPFQSKQTNDYSSYYRTSASVPPTNYRRNCGGSGGGWTMMAGYYSDTASSQGCSNGVPGTSFIWTRQFKKYIPYGYVVPESMMLYDISESRSGAVGNGSVKITCITSNVEDNITETEPCLFIMKDGKWVRYELITPV